MSWVTYSGPVMALAVNSDGKYMVRNEETFSLEKRQFKIIRDKTLHHIYSQKKQL